VSLVRDIVWLVRDSGGLAVENFAVYFEKVCSFRLVSSALLEGSFQNSPGKGFKYAVQRKPVK